MRRVRPWLLGLAIIPAGWVWYRAQDRLMTHAEITAAVPADLRYRPPSERERRAHQALIELEFDINSDPDFGSRRVGDIHRNHEKLWPLVARTDWVLPRLDRALALGVPAMGADYAMLRYGDVQNWTLFRILTLRCDLKNAHHPRADVGRDAVALAGFLRVATLRRYVERNHESFFIRNATESLSRVIGSERLSGRQCTAVLKALPTDAEIVRAQQDRIRYDFETLVVARLRPGRTYSLLNPPKREVEDYRRFLVGRLDVPATLHREMEAARGLMATIATGLHDPRQTAAARERRDVLANMPWPNEGDSGFRQKMKELGFRARLIVHPNARGAVVGLEDASYARNNRERLERTWFALLRARLQRRIGVAGPLPNDPWTARPLRHDPKRHLIWSIGQNGTDDGGISDRWAMDYPDVVTLD